MIKLNANETLFFLLTKYWEYKEVDRKDKEARIDYITRCCKHYCFGDSESDHQVDVFCIYRNLAIKVLSPKHFIDILEYIAPSRHCYSLTPTEGIISQISTLKCVDDDGNDLFEFDYSKLNQKSINKLYEFKKEK